MKGPTIKGDRFALAAMGGCQSWRMGSAPNKSLQQTAAAVLVPRDITALSAAAAAELHRSAAEGVHMAKRLIYITYPPSAAADGDEVRRAIAKLGWTVMHYGIGSSSMERDALDIESEDRPLDHPTLIATLKDLGIPLAEDQFNYTSIIGDVAMPRQSVEWAHGREADIGDVHLEVLDVTPQGSVQWQDRLVPRLGVRCIISPRGSSPLRFPLCLEVKGLREDGKPLSGLATYSGELWHTGEATFEVPTEEPVAAVHLLVRILDIHRGGEVLFRSVPVASSQLS
jgi:hypothetical protein